MPESTKQQIARITTEPEHAPDCNAGVVLGRPDLCTCGVNDSSSRVQAPRCNEHKDRQEIPRCSTCQRIAVEQEIVVRTVGALLAAGYALQTDIQDDPRPSIPTRERDAILAEMMQVDDEFLGVFDREMLRSPSDDPRPVGWVRFVYGNSGYDVISDYTTNLESVLAPVNEYAGTLY